VGKANIADLRRLAERRLPRVVFDYIDGGAESEVTLRENCRVFDQVTFRPRARWPPRRPTCRLPCSAPRSRCRLYSRPWG